MRLLSILGVVGFMTGCVGSVPHLSFAVEQRILRETTLDDLPSGEASEHDSIVRIIRTGRQAGICTGTLIGPHHVLTAQHCMMKVGVDKELTSVSITPGDVHVELGGDYLPWGRVGVREIHECPGYIGGEDRSWSDVDYDVAVLILSQDVPTEVPRMALDYGPPNEDSTFAVIGFGSNTKIRTMPFTSDPSPAAHGAGNWPILVLNRHDASGRLYAATEGHLVIGAPAAHGDSGGPIIDTSANTVVSLVSRGRLDADAKDDDPGGPLAAGPRLSECRKTIDEALRR